MSNAGYYQKAAKLGHVSSFYELAVCYQEGRGTQNDLNSAKLWYKKYTIANNAPYISWSIDAIANQGIPSEKIYESLCKEMLDIGNIPAITTYYNFLINNSKDCSNALEKIEELAQCGNMDAMRRLSSLYYDGVGVKKDQSIALEWFKKLANLGDSNYKVRVAEMYRDGIGVDANPQTALEWFKKAADQKNVIAMHSIILMHASGLIDDTVSLNQAIEDLTQSANGGNMDAMRRVATINNTGIGVKKDQSIALEWFKKLANLGDSNYKVRVAEMYRDGIGTKNWPLS